MGILMRRRLCITLRSSELPSLVGAKRLVPQAWRKWPLFDNIFMLSGVPVITVQLRYDGWITELQDQGKMRNLKEVAASPAPDSVLCARYFEKLGGMQPKAAVMLLLPASHDATHCLGQDSVSMKDWLAQLNAPSVYDCRQTHL